MWLHHVPSELKTLQKKVFYDKLNELKIIFLKKKAITSSCAYKLFSSLIN